MRFESKPDTSKGIAIFTATFGVILLYFSGFIASGLASVILFILGLILMFLTIVAATAKYSVLINREAGLVIKEFSSRFINRQWKYSIADFNSVSILTGGRGAFGEGTVVYSVSLKGPRTLRITSWHSNKDKVEIDAKAVSEYLDMSLENP